jgi:hypothetical protein
MYIHLRTFNVKVLSSIVKQHKAFEYYEFKKNWCMYMYSKWNTLFNIHILRYVEIELETYLNTTVDNVQGVRA